MEVLEFRKVNRYRTKADIQAEKRRMEEYERKMNDGFQVMKKTLRYRTLAEMREIFEEQDRDHSNTMDAKELLQVHTAHTRYSTYSSTPRLSDYYTTLVYSCTLRLCLCLCVC